MGQCSLQNVMDSARAKLRDDINAGGTIFTNANLQDHFATAYRKMFDAFDGIGGANRVQHTVYFNLQPTTGQWVQQADGILDMAEPEVLSERGALTTGTISSTTTDTPIKVNTSAPHGLASGSEVVISDMTGSVVPVGRWWITVTSA